MVTRHTNIDNLIDGWVAINETDDPLQFKAWKNYRREVLGCHFVPKYYTVPSEMPPSTQAAANIYVETLRDIRKEIKWTEKRSKLPDNPRPWNHR